MVGAINKTDHSKVILEKITPAGKRRGRFALAGIIIQSKFISADLPGRNNVRYYIN